jgi:uncharacterized coiled-coil protein SlyX
LNPEPPLEGCTPRLAQANATIDKLNRQLAEAVTELEARRKVLVAQEGTIRTLLQEREDPRPPSELAAEINRLTLENAELRAVGTPVHVHQTPLASDAGRLVVENLEMGSKLSAQKVVVEKQEREIAELRSTIEAVEHEVAKVYCEITGNRISKCNTRAEVVIEAHGFRYEELLRREVASRTEKLQTALNSATAKLRSMEGRVVDGGLQQANQVLLAALEEASKAKAVAAETRGAMQRTIEVVCAALTKAEARIKELEKGGTP